MSRYKNGPGDMLLEIQVIIGLNVDQLNLVNSSNLFSIKKEDCWRRICHIWIYKRFFLSEGRSMWWLSYSAYRKWKNYFQTSIISHWSVDVSVSKRILRKCVSAFASDTVGYFIHCLFIALFIHKNCVCMCPTG